jgi:hypothetical protein
MPLADYGVAIGTLGRFTRENPNNYGSWYHGIIYLNTPQGEYQCAVDVSTPSTVKVQYQVLSRLDAANFAPILALSDGYHHLDSTPNSGAIDFLRSLLLRVPLGCSGIVARVLDWLTGRPVRPTPGWIDSTGDNALNVLEAQVVGSTHIFIFGEPYMGGDRLGMHNIHYNQGDPPGIHQHDDGIWQDGCTIVQRPDGSLVAVLTKFSTQTLNTDNQGLPA